MKHINKFIALGLGIALTFAGSGFIKAEFYDVAKLSHDIEIKVKQKNTITIVYGGEAYFTGKDRKPGLKFNELYIPIEYSGEGVIDSMTISIQNDNTAYNAELYSYESDNYNYVKVTRADNKDFDVKSGILNLTIKYTINGENKQPYDLLFNVKKDNEGQGGLGDNGNHPGHGHQCQVTIVNEGHKKNLIENIPEEDIPPQEDSSADQGEDTNIPEEPSNEEDNNIENTDPNPDNNLEQENESEDEKYPVEILPEMIE